MTIAISAFIVAALVTTVLAIGPVARSQTWRATVTPLASIIGSGFLICGPLLAREFGAAAFGAMLLLLGLAYAVGGVMRFNIAHLEPAAEGMRTHDPMAWAMRIAQGALGLAYAVSVAYYLKLLAEFVLKQAPVAPSLHTIVANAGVTAIILGIVALTFTSSLRRIEHAAHGIGVQGRQPLRRGLHAGGHMIAEGAVVAAPIIASWFGYGTLFAYRMFAVWVPDFLLAFALGIAFQYWSIVPMRHLSPGEGIKAALKADIDQGLADVAAGRVRDFDSARIVARGKKLSADRSSSV